MFNLKREQLVNAPIEKVFDFFKRPENLARITPPWLGFQILSNEPLEMRTGAAFSYKIRVIGLKMKWKSKITLYDPPYKFTDIQIKGPYKKWEHLHKFEKIGNKTLICDSVDYEIYGGIFSNLINKIFVQSKLNDIFNYRKEIINKVFEE